MDEQTQQIIVVFWKQLDFWINLILALIGIAFGFFSVKYSIKSFKEAKDAKEAAQNAGKTVRKQDIIVVLTEILNECSLKENAKYGDSSGKHRLIHRRISNIRGLYLNDLSDDQKAYLVNIETSLQTIRSTLDLFNAAISGDTMDDNSDDFLFLSLEPHMTALSGYIETLKGALQHSLI